MRRFLKLLVPLLLAGAALADPGVSILYHEPVRAVVNPAGAVAGPQSLVFDAYGRRFDLELDNHARLNRLHHLSDTVMLKGQVTGLPDSWVRLMRHGRELSGMIWDGSEAWVIEPAVRAAARLVQPAQDTDVNVIYRLADTLVSAAGIACGSGEPTTTANAQVAMDDLVAELAGPATLNAGTATYRLSLGAIADFDMFQRFGSVAATESTILDRLQIVDGIYSEQLGIQIDPGEIEVFTSQAESDQVFSTSDDARTVLEHLADYRDNPASGQAQYGATHLLTGRNLTSNVNGSNNDKNAGIAYQGLAVDGEVVFGICTDATATSVSESAFSVAISSLIIAHELGHNFGAPHDGDPPCDSTPPGYLMEADINGNDEFSQCSLDEMQAVISAAIGDCLTEIPDEGVAVTGPSTVSAVVDTDFDVRWEISNNGLQDAANVTIELNVPPELELVALTPTAGSCDVALASCAIGSIGGGSVRGLTATLRAGATGTASLRATVAADFDENPADNSATTSVRVTSTASQSSGGGGGASGVLSLLALLLTALLRRRADEFE